MTYYTRQITRREKINRFGKLGFVLYTESFKTDSEDFATQANKGKRVRYEKTTDSRIMKALQNVEPDTIISGKVEVLK